MHARQPRVPRFLFAPSSPPSVPQLPLLPSLLQRPEAPILLPHSPCRLVSWVKLSPPQRMPSAQANKSSATPTFPSALSKSRLSPALAVQPMGFLDRLRSFPQIWGPRAGFCSSQLFGCGASLGTPTPPVLAWGWLPCRLGDPGVCSTLRALQQPGISTGTTAQLKSQGLVRVL